MFKNRYPHHDDLLDPQQAALGWEKLRQLVRIDWVAKSASSDDARSSQSERCGAMDGAGRETTDPKLYQSEQVSALLADAGCARQREGIPMRCVERIEHYKSIAAARYQR